MKHIKMLLYGEPGVGKSVFAVHSPNPFFISTDGNYEWLEDFGGKPDACAYVNNWQDTKRAFANSFDGYDTIVVDLLEDTFKWCEADYCKKTRIDHVSDAGYGKGYDITRNEFFLEICKLLAKPKNVILICHSTTFTQKDKFGNEHTKISPSSRIPDKVIDMIEGRLRYCLYCYYTTNENNIKSRRLSLIPKDNEFGVIRGVDESKIPQDIELDYNVFISTINTYSNNSKSQSSTTTSTATITDTTTIPNNISIEFDSSTQSETQAIEPSTQTESPIQTQTESPIQTQTESNAKTETQTESQPQELPASMPKKTNSISQEQLQRLKQKLQKK